MKIENLTAGVTRYEKSTLKSAIETINSVNILLAFIAPPLTGAKAPVRHI